MKRIQESYQLAVAGGGLAGVCAAIAAARGGLKTCLHGLCPRDPKEPGSRIERPEFKNQKFILCECHS